MAKYDKRIKARKMRMDGVSIITIAKQLNVTKGSVSLWCRDILLSPEQTEKLRKQKGSIMGRWMGAESNRKKKRESIEKADLFGKKFIGKISKRELAIIATALYWAEGSKAVSTGRFIFINSDPEMVFIMKKFLVSVMGVSPDEIVCSIQINKIHEERIGVVLNFWKNLLGLQSNQMNKPYYVNTKVNKVYENYENYFGVCRLIVSKSSYLKYQMIGMIKALKRGILPA